MSSLVVEVCQIDEVVPHPNADRMSIAVIKGWRTCIGKGQMKQGDSVVFFPPDAILPIALAERLGVAKYLSPTKEEGVITGGRVKVARLRGEPSYGLVIASEDPAWEVGRDVAEHYGVTKWEPPLDCTDGDAEREHTAFHTYFNLENINNFPGVFQEGEEVVFTEKIHGMNARAALIRDTEEDGSAAWRFMAGSHNVRRKEMQIHRKRHAEIGPDGNPVMETVMKPVRDKKGRPIMDEAGKPKEEEVTQEKCWFYETSKRSQFWEIVDAVNELLVKLCNGKHNVVIFGELYGTQDMMYGLKPGRTAFRVFDITIDGKYMDFDDKVAACNKHLIDMVPILYRGPFSQEKVREYVSGPTTLCAPEQAGTFKGREGIVITSVKEREVTTAKKHFSRAALKAVSFEYQERKGGTEAH